IAEDQAAEINKQVTLVMNQLTSKKRAIMKVHGISEEEAVKILEEIRKENELVMPESMDLFGTNNKPHPKQDDESEDETEEDEE
ncbi:hypothetical protein, partial [Streptococcus sobrinus]|uniref:hypothetical protein n=1 Tax=Streptococcus sobrinus TaxID=1310 RepID=UPI0005B371A0